MARLRLSTPTELLAEIGRSARALRLHQNLTQQDLAERADVGTRTVQRLETTGRVSMEALVRIAFALGAEDALEHVFERPAPKSIDDVLESRSGPSRQRARGSK